MQPSLYQVYQPDGTNNEAFALCDECEHGEMVDGERTNRSIAALESQLAEKDAALAEALEALEELAGIMEGVIEDLDYSSKKSLGVDSLTLQPARATLAKLRPNKEGRP